MYLHPLISSPFDGGEFSASHPPPILAPRNVICYLLSMRLGGPHNQYERFGEQINLFQRCASSRTVPGSIPRGITGFLGDIFPSDRTMALRSTQSLVKMNTRNVPGGKGGRCVRLTTSPPSCAECHENLGA